MGAAREQQQVILETSHHYQHGSRFSQALGGLRFSILAGHWNHMGSFKSPDADGYSSLFCNDSKTPRMPLNNLSHMCSQHSFFSFHLVSANFFLSHFVWSNKRMSFQLADADYRSRCLCDFLWFPYPTEIQVCGSTWAGAFLRASQVVVICSRAKNNYRKTTDPQQQSRARRLPTPTVNMESGDKDGKPMMTTRPSQQG